jgi:uncharacterized protein
MKSDNPFRIHGTVTGDYFTNREAELDRFRATLREPGAKLVVYGYRRTGKTSALEVAAASIRKEGGHAIVADLSTATTITDLGNRILEAQAVSLGRRWRDMIGDLAARFKGTLKLTTDPVTGLIIPSVDVSLRDASSEEQSRTLVSVLDAVNALAGERAVLLGLVLDEFQELAEIGGPRAEWTLRGAIQRHQHVSYIFAGSKPHLIRRMVHEKGRALYQLADELSFGPIDPRHMASWIDERLASVGQRGDGVGETCVRLAGPRTRDIVELARKCADRANEGRAITDDAVGLAFLELIEEKDDGIRSWWDGLTANQQNVLRAVAGSSDGLTTTSTRSRFSLPSTGTATNTAKALLEDGRLVKTTGGSGYVFDNPFVRGWVVRHALPDLGLSLPLTHRASETAEYAAPGP